MKRFSAIGLGLLMCGSVINAADDKVVPPPGSKLVRVQDCQITLIEHVTLASDRSGNLKHVGFKEGQLIAAGAQVALIDDDVAKANLAVAEKKASNEVDVKFARISRDAAKKEYDMAVEANKNRTGAVSGLEIDKAKLAFNKAELQIEMAEHELAQNKLNRDVTAAELKTYSVVAGFDGVVTRIYKKKGEAVHQGDPIAEIVNTDRVRIEGRVNLKDLPYAKQGAKVLVRLKLNLRDFVLPEEKEVFEGQITFVDLTSDASDKTTRVFAEVQNRDNILRAGLRAEMEIEVDPQTAAKANRGGADDKLPNRFSSSKTDK